MRHIIEQVELRHVRLRLKSSFRTSFGREFDRECILIRLFSEGEQGWGECVAGSEPGYSYETVGTAWHVLKTFFIPALLIKGVESARFLQLELKEYRGHPLARAGLEMALWDLEGRKSTRSLMDMLDGSSPRVPVGVSIGIQERPEDLLDRIGQYLDNGYSRVKIKIAPGADIEVLRAVRSQYPDLRLWVDANAAYTPQDTELIEQFDGFGLELIEQPLYPDDLVEHADLQRKLNTPICLDESIHHLRDAQHALRLGSCRVINLKPARVGGYQVACEIETFCREGQIPVWCGGMLETGIGRAANLALASRAGFCLPGDISATDRYYETDIVEPEFTLNTDSTIDVPQQPGLGIKVDLENLDKHTLREEIIRPQDV